jgi:hypothetical protein
MIAAVFWLGILTLVAFGCVGCSGSRVASLSTSTTEFRFSLLPAPAGTGSDPSDYRWGYVDTSGKWVVQPQFDKAEFFSEGLAPVDLDGKWGYIDGAGSLVIQPQFTEAHYFWGGLARVATGHQLDDNKAMASGYGFIDRTGRMVLPASWDDAGDFSEGLAPVMSGSKCGFIDSKGTLVIPLEFDMVGPFSEGLAQACVGGKCGYIDTKGHWRIKPQYVSVDYADIEISAVLQQGSAWVVGGRFRAGLAPVYVQDSRGAEH